jgi:hypothetical protein
LAAVPLKLSPGQATPHCALAAKLLTDQMGKTTDSNSLELLAKGLAAVTAKLPLDQATPHYTKAAKLLTDQMAETTDRQSLERLAEGLAAVTAKLPPAQATPGCALAAKVLAEQMAETENSDALKILAEGLKAVIGKMDQRGLVNLLKDPLCLGPAQKVILEELGQRAGCSFATLWDLVAWAEEHEPGLDLHTPWQPPRGLDE